MEKTELMVGNIVYATVAGEIHGKLEEHTIKNGADIDNAHWYFPVPISNSVLKRLGFKVNSDYWWSIYSKEMDYTFEFLRNYENQSTYELMGYTECDVEIEYVHQLQNLCTGLLKLKLKLRKAPTKRNPK